MDFNKWFCLTSNYLCAENSLLKKLPENYQLISQKRPYRQEGAGKKYSKSWKARAYIQDHSIQQSYHLEWKGR